MMRIDRLQDNYFFFSPLKMGIELALTLSSSSFAIFFSDRTAA
jgi:hypothetical protein